MRCIRLRTYGRIRYNLSNRTVFFLLFSMYAVCKKQNVNSVRTLVDNMNLIKLVKRIRAMIHALCESRVVVHSESTHPLGICNIRALILYCLRIQRTQRSERRAQKKSTSKTAYNGWLLCLSKIGKKKK